MYSWLFLQEVFFWQISRCFFLHKNCNLKTLPISLHQVISLMMPLGCVKCKT